MSHHTISVDLRQQQDYQFAVEFASSGPTLITDEPPPLGKAEGPSPVDLLCAAVGNCLSDSLLFACRKFRQHPEPLQCRVTAELGRNSDARLRVLGMNVTLMLGVPAESLEFVDRVLSSFEAYCTVTQSVGIGIPITVTVKDSRDQILK